MSYYSNHDRTVCDELQRPTTLEKEWRRRVEEEPKDTRDEGGEDNE